MASAASSQEMKSPDYITGGSPCPNDAQRPAVGSQAAAGCQRRNGSGSAERSRSAEPEVVGGEALVVDLQRWALADIHFNPVKV